MTPSISYTWPCHCRIILSLSRNTTSTWHVTNL